MRSRPMDQQLKSDVLSLVASGGQSLALELRRDMESHLELNLTAPDVNPEGSLTVETLMVGSADDPCESEADAAAWQAVIGPAGLRRHDLANVRIHCGTAAAASALALGARAYTLGNNIVFASGQFSPHTLEGRLLLAHELAHVIQQRRSGRVLVQRAEVGDTQLPAGIRLNDLRNKLNSHINSSLRQARSTAAAEKDFQARAAKIASLVYKDQGAISLRDPVHAPVEKWVNRLHSAKVGVIGDIYKPSQAQTRYAGLSSWFLSSCPVALVNGTLIGTDKIGHFFQLGFYYFARSRKLKVDFNGLDLADHFGDDDSEVGSFGLGSTGVYSRADIAANRKGQAFYEDLLKNPKMNFDISSYIARDWNEAINSNVYIGKIASTVWKNVLTRRWTGDFTSESKRGLTKIATRLVGNGSGVTGEYDYTETSGNKVEGSVQDGKITFIKSPAFANAVTHIEILFDWSEGSSRGKGRWVSSTETEFQGTWGNGPSRSDGGSWNLRREFGSTGGRAAQ